jgi:hypothetical protein
MFWLPPRDSETLKTNEMQKYFSTVPLYVPHENLAFILRFPTHLVALFETTSDIANIAKRHIVRLAFQCGPMVKHCFDQSPKVGQRVLAIEGSANADRTTRSA